MGEFIGCEKCSPEDRDNCALMRRIAQQTPPILSQEDAYPSEGTVDYAYRSASRLLALYLIARVDDGCTEFVEDVEIILSLPGAEAYLHEAGPAI